MSKEVGISPSSPLQIAILGVGGIGSTFAFQLARTGQHEVTAIARPGSARLQQLQQDGSIVNTKGERAPVHVAEALDEAIPYDLVLVTVPAQQIEAVLPGLRRSKARWIQFMFQVFNPEQLRDAVGADRCSFGMPFLQATVDQNGALNAKIGAGGQKSKMSHPGWVQLFQAAGLPAVLEPDMLLWLRCHVPLAASFESVCVAGMARGGGASWAESITIARAMQESFHPDRAPRLPALSSGKTTAPRQPGMGRGRDALVYVAHPLLPGAPRNRSERVSRTGRCVGGQRTSREPACLCRHDSGDEAPVEPAPSHGLKNPLESITFHHLQRF